MYNILYILIISFIFYEFFLWMTNKYCRNSSIHDLDIGADSVILKILCEGMNNFNPIQNEILKAFEQLGEKADDIGYIRKSERE